MKFTLRRDKASARSDWPIIVGGCQRSGTSLVRRMLDAHSRIHCGPEVKFLRDLHGDYFEDPLRHLRFTTSARSIAPEAELLEVLGRAFVELHERAARRAGKARWADKNPENVLYLSDWECLLGERWLFVLVVRTPLDTLASIQEARFPLSIPASLEDRVDHFKRYVQAGLDYLEVHPKRSYLLRYERLVESPEEELSRLMRFAGERFEPGQLDFNKWPHEAGLEDYKIAVTSEVHAASVGRWEDILTMADADYISRETEALWARVERRS